MATVKKSNKKKIVIPICIVLVIAIIVGGSFSYSKSKSVETVALYTISDGDISENVSLTGKVRSGMSMEYKVSAVATVKDVFVKVGDRVSQNDLLASFDVTSLDGQIASLQSSYNDAQTSYNNAVANQHEAEVKANALRGEIARLEASIGSIQNSSSNSKPNQTQPATTQAPTTQAPTTTEPDPTKPPQINPAIPGDADIVTTIIYYGASSPTDITSEFTNIAEQLEQLNQSLASLTTSMEQLLEVTSIIANDLALITSIVTDVDVDELAEKMVADLVASGVLESVAREIVSSIDFEGFANTIVNADATQLTAAQIQLITLRGQYALFNAQASPSLVNAQKKAVEATKSSLELMKAQKEELSQGWKAGFDGTITAVDIFPGMQTTLLTAGITLENLDSMTVTVSLSEYDYHKVKVGMPAVITTAYGLYDGEVLSIAPTATGGSSSSMLDSVGSMAGISGLSSLTDSGAGVQCTVSIPQTDSNIVAGFDANVEIKTGEYNGIPVVPIESIVLEKEGSYVYLYNEEDGTVTKTRIETGAISDSAYEIKSGLKPGDRIIAAPAGTYEEDTFKVKVK